MLAAAGVALAVAGVFSGDDDNAPAPPRAVATIPAGKGPDGLAVSGNTVWVANAGGAALTRLDARTNRKTGAPVPVGGNPDSVAVADGSVWVTNTDDGTVTRLNAGPSPGDRDDHPGRSRTRGHLGRERGSCGWPTATATA